MGEPEKTTISVTSGVGEAVARLIERATFMRHRAAAWKKAAKHYRNLNTFMYANPGFLLAKMVYEYEAGRMKGELAELGHKASECLGWVFEDLLCNNPQAPNFIEITLSGKHDNLLVTVHRPHGKKPAQMLAEAKARIAELEAELARRRAADSVGMVKCADESCNTLMGPDVPGLPKYCPTHNDLNPNPRT